MSQDDTLMLSFMTKALWFLLWGENRECNTMAIERWTNKRSSKAQWSYLIWKQHVKVFHCHYVEAKLWRPNFALGAKHKYFKLMKTAFNPEHDLLCQRSRPVVLTGLSGSFLILSCFSLEWMRLRVTNRWSAPVLTPSLDWGLEWANVCRHLVYSHCHILKQLRILLCRDVFCWLKRCLLIAHRSRRIISERASGKQ